MAKKYCGQDYQSLLEEKWAVMFEMFGWQFEYRPFDLDGWIPDFAIIGEDCTTLVKIEKIFRFDRDTYIKYGQIVDKLCYDNTQLLMLGASLPICSCDTGRENLVSIGWMNHPMWIERFDWDEIISDEYTGHAILSVEDNKIGIKHCSGCFIDKIFSGIELYPKFITSNKLETMWKEAGNIVQKNIVVY